MRQRVQLAQALLGDPKLLILDEPTAGLDPEERVRLRQYVAELGRDRIVLITTHITGDVESIADRILLMREGRLLRGDRRLLRAKLSAAALTLLCIWLLYSLRQLWLISERYAPFSGLAAPANSLQCFSALPGWLPLWAAGLGCLLLRLLAMGAAASVVLLISVWAGSQNQASLAAAAALLIPAALFAVGLESVRLLTPLELLAPLNWRLPLWPIWAGLSAAALVFTLRRWRRKL